MEDNNYSITPTHNNPTPSPPPAFAPTASSSVVNPPSHLNSAPQDTFASRLAGQSASTSPIQPQPKKWPLVLSIIAFVLSSVAFLVIGPGVLIAALMTRPFSWIISFYYVYIVVGTAAVSIIATILYLISIVAASKRLPDRLSAILAMMAGSVVGNAVIWLSGYNIIRINVIWATVIMLACILLPCVVLIILHHQRKKSPQIPPQRNVLRTIIGVILILTSVAEVGVAVYYYTQLWSQYKPIIDEQQRLEQEKQQKYDQVRDELDQAGASGVSEVLGDASYALCYGEYALVYQAIADPNDIIVQCKADHDLYEIYNVQTDADMGNDYYKSVSAVYLGTTYNETVARYFPDAKYIFIDFHNSQYPKRLILLLEAEGISRLIGDSAPKIYDYVKDINKINRTDMQFEIFYNNNIDSIQKPLDYVILQGVHGINMGWLPKGNGMPGLRWYYVFNDGDAVPALTEIGANPSNYSSQTREAIKFHEHLQFEVNDGKTITLEELKTRMENSIQSGA